MQIDVLWFWYILSMALFLLEAFGLPGLGFLFAALAAFCVGVLLQNDLLDIEDFLMQGSAFFGLTVFWAILLWKPLKKMRMSRPSQSHNDMIGRTASVAIAPLVKGKAGNVSWSGTTMRARLVPDAAVEQAEVDTELKIVGVEGATLLLAEVTYTLPDNE